MKFGKKILASVLGLGAALGAVPAPLGYAHGGAPTSAGTLTALAWGDCPDYGSGVARSPRLRCAALTVPLDYRDPHHHMITITISKLAATEPAQRRGILLVNPGGPGGSGIDFPLAVDTVLPPEVRSRYDLIGFDPRGVGHSTPVSCGLTPQTPFTLILPYPDPNGSIKRNITFGRTTAAACAAHSGDLLPHITTANTARDMDRIRAALGEPKLNYYGASYGTYLGAVYTSLFPRHSGRIVLDSAVDPALVWYQMWRTWNRAVAIRLPDFLRFAAAHDATYQLGATPAQVRRTYFALTRRLDQEPIPLDDGTPLDGNLLREVTRSLLYRDADFPLLATVWQVLSGSASAVAGMQIALWQPSTTADVPSDNAIAALYAVTCGDAAWPRSVSGYASRVLRDRKRYPITAGMPSNLWPCTFWPTARVQPPVPVTDQGPRDVLILQNTRDPATSLRSGLGLRRALGARAAMVTVGQGGHGVLGSGACADQITFAYLAGADLPGSDRFCAAAVDQPSPSGPVRALADAQSASAPNELVIPLRVLAAPVPVR